MHVNQILNQDSKPGLAYSVLPPKGIGLHWRGSVKGVRIRCPNWVDTSLCHISGWRPLRRKVSVFSEVLEPEIVWPNVLLTPTSRLTTEEEERDEQAGKDGGLSFRLSKRDS